MESLRIDILNPKALNLFQNLVDLDLIRISSDTTARELVSTELPNTVKYGLQESLEQADKGVLIAHETQELKYKKYLK